MTKTITTGVTIVVVGALILSTVTMIGTTRVHSAVLENHTNRHDWAVDAIRRNETKINATAGEVKTGMAILIRIEDRLKRIEEKLEAR